MSTYTPIASITLASAQSSVTFNGIPQTYTDLVYVIYNKSGGINSSIRFNGDGGSNYSLTQLYGNGSAAASLRSSNVTYGIGGVIGNDATVVGHIMNYSNTTTNKTLLGRGGAASDTYLDACVTLWRSTSAITSVTFYQNSGALNWASGSTFNLYGVANASITNTAKATGGDSITTDGTYWIHTFTSSGTFTANQTLSCDVLVVGGGGGGGGGYSGTTYNSGGAGGIVTQVTGRSVSSGSYAVTVGTGGAVSTSSGASGGNGGSSSIALPSAISATGGNGGTSVNSTATGGRGGANASFTGGSSNTAGGGGAGAGGNGGNAGGASSGGNGGAGVTATILGYGVAGGGAGPASGGSGTASDGGGAGDTAPSRYGGGGSNQAGANGVVIVRYPV